MGAIFTTLVNYLVVGIGPIQMNMKDIPGDTRNGVPTLIMSGRERDISLVLIDFAEFREHF